MRIILGCCVQPPKDQHLRLVVKDHDYVQSSRLRFKVHVLEHDWI